VEVDCVANILEQHGASIFRVKVCVGREYSQVMYADRCGPPRLMGEGKRSSAVKRAVFYLFTVHQSCWLRPGTGSSPFQ
jgi:hypothetical protein